MNIIKAIDGTMSDIYEPFQKALNQWFDDANENSLRAHMGFFCLSECACA